MTSYIFYFKFNDDCNWFLFTGLTDIKCHEKFKTCIKRVHKSGRVGFSRDCPYNTAVPTMTQGMDLAILFSQFGDSKFELWMQNIIGAWISHVIVFWDSRRWMNSWKVTNINMLSIEKITTIFCVCLITNSYHVLHSCFTGLYQQYAHCVLLFNLVTCCIVI